MPGTLEFTNSRGAVVGIVAGDAIVVDIAGCGGFSTVEICFPPIATPTNISSSLLNQSTLVLDFALGRVAQPNSLQPLGLQLSKSACGILTSLPSDAMVVPVWRVPEFKSATPAVLSTRGKAAVLVTATGYLHLV